MDPLIAAAAHALAAGDPLGALKRVALRDDAPALALRGTAMAQLGDFDRAKTLLRRAARAFEPGESLARARCVVAEAEIALASRELAWPVKALASARATLTAHGDLANAAHAQYLEARRLLLIGRLNDAERVLDALDPAPLPSALRAAHELAVAGIAMRRVRARSARSALERAGQAARRAGIPALMAEVESALRELQAPAARMLRHGEARTVRLAEIETLLASRALIVDGCRYAANRSGTTLAFATRPILFTLLRVLAEAWPGDAPRETLVVRAFRLKHADDSLRARLRVEMGRLRKALRPMAEVRATARGFALVLRDTDDVVVLAPPVEEKHAEVLAMLADGESWSSSALALALGMSQRNLQRTLESLAASGRIQSFGRGRARRWMTPPLPGITTILLLPAPLSGD